MRNKPSLLSTWGIKTAFISLDCVSPLKLSGKMRSPRLEELWLNAEAVRLAVTFFQMIYEETMTYCTFFTPLIDVVPCGLVGLERCFATQESRAQAPAETRKKNTHSSKNWGHFWRLG